MKIKEIKAVGETVVLKAIPCEEKQEEKKTASGLILPAQEQKSGTKINDVNGGKVRVKLVVHSIGDGVDKDKYKFNVGDEVICNDLDLQTVGDDSGEMYSLTRAVSIRAVIKPED